MNSVIKNLLALDIGTKRVGIARADLTKRLIEAVSTENRAQNQALNKILSLLEEYNTERIIIGLPLGASGQRTDQCEDAESFARRLERRTDVEIVFFDEFLSTKEAHEELGLKNPTQQERKKSNIDAVAASIFLKDYIKENL